MEWAKEHGAKNTAWYGDTKDTAGIYSWQNIQS